MVSMGAVGQTKVNSIQPSSKLTFLLKKNPKKITGNFIHINLLAAFYFKI